MRMRVEMTCVGKVVVLYHSIMRLAHTKASANLRAGDNLQSGL